MSALDDGEYLTLAEFAGLPADAQHAVWRAAAEGRVGFAHVGHPTSAVRRYNRAQVREALAARPAAAAPGRPSPAELWQRAGGDRGLYRDLLREHGHLTGPGDPGYDPDAPKTLPCGWEPGNRPAGEHGDD